MKIVFAGTPVFAAAHLAKILDNGEHDIIGVYTQPDRPSGRGKRELPSAVKSLALKNNLLVHQPLSLNNAEEVKVFNNLKPDVMVVVAYGMILPKSILQGPQLGCINVHTSLLPRWRGAAPIQRAIQNGDTESGVSVIQMDEGLDTGPILGSKKLSVSKRETAQTLRDQMSLIGPTLLLTVLSQIETGEVCAIKQNPSQACYAKKIIKSECKINWIEDAINLERSIRAFNPDSVMFTEFNRQRVKIWQASSIETSPLTKDIQRVGTILRANKDGLLIKCGNGELLITEMQLPGKVKMKVSEILKSKREYFSVGSMFE